MLARGEVIVENGPSHVTQKLKPKLDDLKEHWGRVIQHLEEHGTRLLEASELSNYFQEKLNQLMSWLTTVEHQLNNQPPVSRLLRVVTQQKEDHKVHSGV